MSYVVLARKWRPKFFEEVVGQGHVARTLTNAITQDRVAHAFLFTGARGVGKTSIARILAKALNCEASDGPTPKPCNECASCLAITSGQSVDAFEIDGASNRGINEIRELRESVRYAPSRGRYKIYIIDEVHMLTTEAFNALLKTLEEPPPHAKFIFATTEPQKIPVTILSRCQRYDFKRIRQGEIVGHLEFLCKSEGITADRASLQIMARQAAGGMRDAMSLLDQVISFAGTQINEELVNEILGVANRRHLFELSAAVLNHNAEAALLVLDEVNGYGYDLQQFASEALRHFRDLMVVSVVRDASVVTDLTDNEIAIAQQQVGGIDRSLLHRCFGVLSSVALEMSRSSFPKLVFEMGVLRLAHLEPLLSMDVVVERLALLESSFDGDLPAVDYPSSSGSRPSVAPTVAPATARAPEAPGATLATPEEELVDDKEEDPAPPQRASEPVVDDVPADGTAAVSMPSVEPVIDSESAEPQEAKPSNAEPPSVELVQDTPSLVPEEPVGEPSETPVEEPIAAPVEELVEAPVEEAPGAKDEEPSEVPVAEPVEQIAAPPTLTFAERAPAPSEPPPEPEDEVDPIDLIAALAPDQILALTPGRRWQVIVDTIRPINQPLAAICEHAFVEQFDEGIVELAFADKYLELLQHEDRVSQLKRTVCAVFGAKYCVEIQTRGQEEGGTIAHDREASIEETRKSLKEELLQNPAVVQAQELFDVDPEKVRVQVQLFDEPQ